jgi:phosphatidylinositol glycan class K
MLADDVSCNPRNAFPATVFNNQERMLDLYGENIEVDYRGYEVTVENFIRLVTDRWEQDTPRSKRLLTDDRSNILFYMTGHGGNEFLKFQDAEEISAFDIANAFEQMWEKRRYNEILFMIDTCQANTMYSKFYSPNILAIGSSEINQNSYSHHGDLDVGVAVIDRFTYYNLEFLEGITKNSKQTMADLIASYNPTDILSEPGIRSDLFPDALDKVLITDFFGNIQNVNLDEEEESILQNARLMKENEQVLSLISGQTESSVEPPREAISETFVRSATPKVVRNDKQSFDLPGGDTTSAQLLRRPEVVVMAAIVFFVLSSKLC